MADDKTPPKPEPAYRQWQREAEARAAHNFSLRDDQAIANSKTHGFGARDKDADEVKYTHDAHYKFKQINEQVKGTGVNQGPLSVNVNDYTKALEGTYKKTSHGKDNISPEEFVNSRDELRRKNPAQNPGDPAMSRAQDQATVARHTYTDKDGKKQVNIPEMVMEAKTSLLHKQYEELKTHHADPKQVQHAKDEYDKSSKQWHAKRQELGLEKPPQAKAVDHSHDHTPQAPNVSQQQSQAAQHGAKHTTPAR